MFQLIQPFGFEKTALLYNLCRAFFVSLHDDLSGNPSGITVYLGRQSQQGSNPNEERRTVTQIIVHPGFSFSTLDNDIALMKLSSPVTFNAYISPVCLAASDSTFYSGVNSWVTGWGNIGSSGRSRKVLMSVQENLC